MSGQKATIRINEVDLAIRIDGDAGRPWIVLLNGLATDCSSWDSSVPALTQTHRVLRYDARGHGRSSTPPGPYTFADLTSDVLGLMDLCGIEKADLLGLSMGGMTALGLAIDHEDRVGRVICCAARADAPAAFVASWDSRIATIQASGGMSGVATSLLDRWFTAEFRNAHPEAVQAAAAMIEATDPKGYIACAEALKQLDYKRSLARVRAPTLFVCGAQDEAAPSVAMREMAALTPGSAYDEVNPGAHLCNIEDPGRFNAIVGNWLAGTER